MRAVEGADPPQAPEHVRDIRAEHPAIRVQLVQDDVAEVLEELHPLGVVGKDPGVEHVRVRDDDVPRAADRGAHRRRRIAVVGVGLELDVDVGREPLELGELILRERLRRKDVERARRGVLRDRVDDREVVAKCFAARGGGHDDGVLSGVCRLERLRLVRVERGDAAPPQGRGDPAVEPVRQLRVGGGLRGQALPARDHLLEVVVAGEAVEDLLQADARGEPNSRSHRAARYGTPVLTSR